MAVPLVHMPRVQEVCWVQIPVWPNLTQRYKRFATTSNICASSCAALLLCSRDRHDNSLPALAKYNKYNERFGFRKLTKI